MRSSKFILVLIGLFLAVFWWAGGNTLLPQIDLSKQQLRSASGNVTSIWDRVSRVVALKGAVDAKLNRTHYVQLQDIPLTLQQAMIAVEDNRFYRHIGIDIEGILRATLVNAQSGAFSEGGSTITQQLVKNLFLTQDKTVERKIEEVVLALDMELRYSKEDILEMYFNTIYFGSGAYGIHDAAWIYFKKAPASLNLAESSLLAGLPNAPSLYSPFVDYTASKQRQAIVLSSMNRYGFIGPNAAQEAKLAPLNLAK